MDTKHKYNAMEVSVFAIEEEIANKILRGRVLIDPSDSRCTVVQNTPRGARSREIGRTMHARIVERPDGDFTITFRIPRNEKFKRETLIVESRTLAKIMNEITEAKPQKNERKEHTTTDE